MRVLSSTCTIIYTPMDHDTLVPAKHLKPTIGPLRHGLLTMEISAQ